MNIKNHYVNNKELLEEFKRYHEKKKQWILEGKPGHPPLTEKIGIAIIQIANKRCYSRWFYNYTNAWKEEMVCDAIEIATRYAHNFNPEKSNNPFAYLTQIITNAIKLRIKKEKRQIYLKYKMFTDMEGFQGEIDDKVNDEDMEFVNDTTDMFKDHLEFIAEYEESQKKEIKKRKKQNTIGLDMYLDD